MAVESDSHSSPSADVCLHLESRRIELARRGQCVGEELDCVDAAREVPSVRAALCSGAFSAWNGPLASNANVIVLSIHLTSQPLAREIIGSCLKAVSPTEPRSVTFHRQAEELGRHYWRVPRGSAVATDEAASPCIHVCSRYPAPTCSSAVDEAHTCGGPG